MTIERRPILAAIGATALGGLPWRSARAQAANTIKIGLLSDMSGPYRDINGPVSLAATRLAIQEFGARGFQVEMISADHQNRPDVALNIARQWYDRDGVDMILNLAASSVALAVAELTREKNKVTIATSTASSDMTGRACTPNSLHWSYDTYMVSKSTGGATVRAGGDTWFFITADYAFGHALERDTANFVRAAGGRVVGQVRTPFPGTTDFSSFLLQAQASRAKVIGLANAGTDTINCVKQAAEFGIMRRGIKLASMLLVLPDVHALGLEAAAGIICTESFYWDLNDRTRSLVRRVHAISGPAAMGMSHAGDYSGTLHFLKAVADLGIQGAKGKLFGKDYEAGSWLDQLVEAFSGSHDMIGGKLTGLYDEQGNIKRGMSKSERKIYDKAVTTTSILPSIPFAVSELLSPEVWKAMSIFLKAAR
ncbi:MAG: ABC transporter substrate-binding protein [Acetobacteraceae bacterium]|nr:ABC transporter substrate-binding protein [Acetobacteraceae bacterium]